MREAARLVIKAQHDGPGSDAHRLAYGTYDQKRFVVRGVGRSLLWLSEKTIANIRKNELRRMTERTNS